MLKWALIFFLASLVAGGLGFTGVASTARSVSRVLFYVAISIFLIFLVLALMAGEALF